ncbi:MAG: rhomboid family intramembrane serine protease [Candidatus Nanopelagicales bacterium]
MSQTPIEPVCYNHNNEITYVRCSRCEKYICVKCMNPASIGYQCPECAGNVTKIINPIQQRRFIPTRQKAKITKFLTISLVVVYALQSLLGDILIANFALFAPSVSQGKWWLLITAGFLHGSILHLFFNAYILWVVGGQLESIVGSIRFGIIYFVSLLGGSIASYLFSPFGSYSVGASGAIFGLMGAMLVVGRKIRIDISQITTLVILNVVLGFVISGIDWRAHLGGLFAGALITWILFNATLLKDKTQ